MRRTLLMIAAVALLLTQCRKPAVELPTAGPANENMVSMTVTVGHGRTLIGADGAITWSENDKLYVGDGSKYIGCLELQSGEGSATGTFSGSVTADAGTYTFGFYYLGSNPPAVADNATTVDIPFGTQTGLIGDLDDCHIGYGTAAGEVKDGSVILENPTPVTMTSKVAIAYFEFKENGTSDYTGVLTLSGDHIYNKMTVNFNASDFDFTPVKDGNIRLDGGHAQRYVMLVPPATVVEETLEFGGGAEGSTKFYKGIEANKFYCLGAGEPIAVTVTKPISIGTFTVSSGVTVSFSPGNLQYLGQAEEGHKWRFAEHQWDIMGAGPSATSNKGNVDLSSLGYTAEQYNYGSAAAGGSETEADSEAARDLFGWGATGFQDERTKPTGYQINYQPYSTSTSSVSGGSSANYYGYGPDYDANKYGLTVAAKSDWGCVTGLPSVGDGKTWRTLTSAEWKYLLDTRTVNGGTGEGKSYQRATINSDATGVYGMLLYPDGYTSQTGASSYTAEQFQTMEQAGVVFLPAAGYRYGASLYDVGSYGYYWSSSCLSGIYACLMYFCSGNVNPQDGYDRYYGFSVRLVR